MTAQWHNSVTLQFLAKIRVILELSEFADKTINGIYLQMASLSFLSI